MAKSFKPKKQKPIKASDIYEKDIFKPYIKETDKLIKNISEIEKGLKRIAALVNQ